MNLTHLTDKSLLTDTKKLARDYRHITAQLLHHLREIDARKLYSELGYSTLFNYVVQELGFSEASASRRISAMKILKEIPEIEEKIESGDLNLTHLGIAANVFKKEKVTDIEFKKEVLSCIENTSTRTCEKTLLEIVVPSTIKPPVIEYRNIAIREDIYKKFDKIRGLLAAQHYSKDELIEKIFDIAIQEIEKKKFKTTSKLGPESSEGRYIPAGLRKAVFERDRSCVKCGSTYNLQFDHIKPIALGGVTELNNLRLLCHNCNQRTRISSNLHRP